MLSMESPANTTWHYNHELFQSVPSMILFVDCHNVIGREWLYSWSWCVPPIRGSRAGGGRPCACRARRSDNRWPAWCVPWPSRHTRSGRPAGMGSSAGPGHRNQTDKNSVKSAHLLSISSTKSKARTLSLVLLFLSTIKVTKRDGFRGGKGTWWSGWREVSVPRSGGLLISIVCTARISGPVKHDT